MSVSPQSSRLRTSARRIPTRAFSLETLQTYSQRTVSIVTGAGFAGWLDDVVLEPASYGH